MWCARSIKDRTMEVQFLEECVDGYLDWYLIVSHLHIIPPRHHGDDVRPSNVGSSYD